MNVLSDLDHIFAVDWHPESRYTLASAGRDKQIKIWNTKDANLEYYVHSIGPVGKVWLNARAKIHILKISIFTKFTLLKSQFSQNSPLWNLVFHKIHICEISIFSKFTFLKYQNQGNFWIKSELLPHCEVLGCSHFSTFNIRTLILLCLFWRSSRGQKTERM